MCYVYVSTKHAFNIKKMKLFKRDIMKNLNFILTLIFTVAVFFTACNSDSLEPTDNNILPENFTVDIPQSLSSSTIKSLKNGNEDIVQGNDIYENLRVFIHVGDEAAQIVEEVIKAIRLYGLSEPMNFTYEGDDDGRTKNVVIVADSEYEGTVWDYQMTVTDADSESNDDGGVGMQIFWNKGTIKGIAIMQPYNIDHNTEDLFAQAMFRIDYSEGLENAYEQEMTVYISGITLPTPYVDQYAMETMKMTAGRNGDIVEVFGNSNHPNVTFFTENTGFNWAFVAAGSFEADLGVAEVGLPPSDLNSSNRETILETYSLKNVFIREATAYVYETYGFTPTPGQLAPYLLETEAPGYFNAQGFVSGGTSPGEEYNTLSNAIESLVPFNPFEVSNLSLEFKANASVK